MSATQANPYRDYAIDYSYPANCKPDNHGELLAYHNPQQQHSQQPQIHHHDKPPDVPFATAGSAAAAAAAAAAGGSPHTAFEHHPHASTGVIPGPTTQAIVHGIPQPVLLAPHQMLPRHHFSPQYPSTSLEITSAQHGKKRPHAESDPDHDDGRRVRSHLSGFPVEGSAEASQTPDVLFSTQSEQAASSNGFGPQASMALPQQHHHHHMPPQATMRSSHHSVNSRSSNYSSGQRSLVGMPGMPNPRPITPHKRKPFTQDDDDLVVDLKENKRLTWKQIEEFFPGRTSGTLQVRYCTRLKKKNVVWTEEMVSLPSLSSPLLAHTNDNRYNGFNVLFKTMRKTNGATLRGRLETVLRLRHVKKWLRIFDEWVEWMMGYGVVMVMVITMIMVFHWEDGGIVYRGVSHLSLFLCLGCLYGKAGVFVVYTI